MSFLYKNKKIMSRLLRTIIVHFVNLCRKLESTIEIAKSDNRPKNQDSHFQSTIKSYVI